MDDNLFKQIEEAKADLEKYKSAESTPKTHLVRQPTSLQPNLHQPLRANT